MACNLTKVGFDTSPAATAKRNFILLGVTREHKEKRRQAYARHLEEIKRLPRIINKICPNPVNPDQHCFAMTLEVERPPMKKKRPAVQVAATDNQRQCLGVCCELCVEHGKVDEAVQFYEAAFGAELVESEHSKSALLKIFSDLFQISEFDDQESFPMNSRLFYLFTDDVDRVLEKAVKAGASVLGKLIQVYSNCRIWCSLVRLNDPYGNQWIIYSRLCSSCLQSFGLVA